MPAFKLDIGTTEDYRTEDLGDHILHIWQYTNGGTIGYRHHVPFVEGWVERLQVRHSTTGSPPAGITARLYDEWDGDVLNDAGQTGLKTEDTSEVDVVVDLSKDHPAAFDILESAITTSSDTLVDMDDGGGNALSDSIVLDTEGSVEAIITFSISTSSGGSGSVAFAISIDGTDSNELTRVLSGSGDQGIGAVTFSRDSLGPGTITVKGRWRRASGSATYSLDDANLTIFSSQSGHQIHGIGHLGPAQIELLDDSGTSAYGTIKLWIRKFE